MKWIRRKQALPYRPQEKYHLYRDGVPTHDIHYLTTKCRCEIKGHYWDITEDPPIEECCTKCLQLLGMNVRVDQGLPKCPPRKDLIILSPIRHIDGD